VDVVVRWVAAGARDARRPAADELLRRTVAAVHGGGDVRVGRRCPRCGSTAHGAPWARLDDGRQVPVSVTRTDAVLAVAVADHPVGIDLEPHDRALAPGFEAVALSDAERSALAPVGPDTLLRAWVLKEAVLKAAGTGLGTDPRHVRLVRGSDGALFVADAAGVADGRVGWWVGDLAGVPGHVGALALRLPPGPAPTVGLDVSSG
jgi:4'-phosphopantetheinyl transferase